MAQYTIDNNRSINANSRDNFSRGEKNTFLWSTSAFKRTYIHPNNIYTKHSMFIYSDDRLWDNLDTTVQTTIPPKYIRSINDYLFGIQPLTYSVTFPPSYLKYTIL